MVATTKTIATETVTTVIVMMGMIKMKILLFRNSLLVFKAILIKKKKLNDLTALFIS